MPSRPGRLIASGEREAENGATAREGSDRCSDACRVFTSGYFPRRPLSARAMRGSCTGNGENRQCPKRTAPGGRGNRYVLFPLRRGAMCHRCSAGPERPAGSTPGAPALPLSLFLATRSERKSVMRDTRDFSRQGARPRGTAAPVFPREDRRGGEKEFWPRIREGGFEPWHGPCVHASIRLDPP